MANMLNRRQLFTGLGGAAVAAPLVVEAVAPVVHQVFVAKTLAPPKSYFTSNTAWFLKTEHRNGVALFSRSHPVGDILRPGLEKFWAKTYDRHSDEWEEIFAPRQLDLFDDRLCEDTLEQVSIEVKDDTLFKCTERMLKPAIDWKGIWGTAGL